MLEAVSVETQEKWELPTVTEDNGASQASSSSSVEDDTFIMLPNTFDIFLLVDSQETAGYVLCLSLLLNETEVNII